MKKIAAFLCLFSMAVSVSGQENSKLSTYSGDLSYSTDGRLMYIRLNGVQAVPESGIETFINNIVLKNGDTRVHLLRSDKDELGFTNYRYELTQNGIPAANKTILAHAKNGKLVSLNGDLYSIDQPANGFSLTEKNALNYALTKVNAQSYKWENKAEERFMREQLNDPDFSYEPTGAKVVFEKAGQTYNAWRFNIYAEQPLYRANVFVDAATGTVLDEQNLLCNVNVPGTANTKYSGTQTITCDQNGSNYRLRETGRGQGIRTFNMNNGNSYSLASDFTNTATSWTATNNDQGALDAHWGAEMTYDYYMSQHNRSSVDGNGYNLLSFVHYSVSYTNAFWDGQRMTYGDGNGGFYKIFTALDVCGHEISHGLTGNTAGLIYQNESGALNEAFSDIFGSSIENYARPSNWNWKIGEDLTSGGVGLRTMANPNQFSDPDTYGGSFYYTGTADNGGVHTNSGVANYWYYLLVAGGSGTNDLTNPYNVSGIGFTDAAKIAFRALTVYFTPSTTFAQARTYTIKAAEDLFGICSNQLIQTTRAWYAVGVGTDYSLSSLGASFATSNSNFCASPAYVTFTNNTPNGLTYSWDFGDGTVATSTNAAHTFTAVGVYSVKLKVNGCLNSSDSIEKTITINPPSLPPSVAPVSACKSSSVMLTANSAGDITWYGSPSGGFAITTGSSFPVTNAQSNATYYVSQIPVQSGIYGGMTSNTGGGYLSSYQWLNFDVSQSGVLNSVVVYAQTAGNRTFQMRDFANTILNSTVVALSVGANTVALNFPLSTGTNYKLGLSVLSTSNLYRSTIGVSYPYYIGNCVEITGSSAGANNYFWFYNWEISTNGCESARVPLSITVNANPTVTSSSSNTLACMNDEVMLSGEPAGGVFTGSAVTGTSFNASAFGPGTYTVTYDYTDPNGCSGKSANTISVQECTGISENQLASLLSVYPNPAKDIVTVNSGSTNAQLNFVVMDAIGKVVVSGEVASNQQAIDLSGLSQGIYLLNLNDKKGSVVKTVKLIKE